MGSRSSGSCSSTARRRERSRWPSSSSSTRAGFDFEAAWRAVEPEDILTLIYTSGTTGPPKGVQLTHANMIAEVRGTFARLPVRAGGRAMSFLPSAHVADRWSAHYLFSHCLGFTVTCVADMRTVVEHLPEVRPTAWGAVPRIWEKIKAALEAQGVADPGALTEEQRSAIRAKLGLDQAEWLVVGAAPTPPEVLEYFAALGLPICELWGMSELSCCVTINPPERIKIGTCGPPIEGAEVRIADDGEVLVRGRLVMAGYRNDPEKTAQAIDPDGWLRTGDIGELDADGYLRIVDRKKELIINAAGKNMSPANIESRLKAASPLIGQCICIGDRRPYNVALIVLDPDACAAHARARGLDDASASALAASDEVRALVAQAIDEANSHLSRTEQVKRFTILPTDWLPDSDELTPTMKLKRKPIARQVRKRDRGALRLARRSPRPSDKFTPRPSATVPTQRPTARPTARSARCHPPSSGRDCTSRVWRHVRLAVLRVGGRDAARRRTRSRHAERGSAPPPPSRTPAGHHSRDRGRRHRTVPPTLH